MKRSFAKSALAACLLCLSMAANAYVTFGQSFGLSNFEFKWGDSRFSGTAGGTVTYSFLPSGTNCSLFMQGAGLRTRSCVADDPASVFGSSYESFFSNVFESWSQWANIDFVQVADDGSLSGRDRPSASTGIIRIGAARYDRNVFGASFANFGGGDGKGLDGDVLLNSFFGSDFRRDPTFFTGLALHEIGHSLGLAHSDVFLSVMSQSGPFFNTPQADDIAGIQAIYGLRSQVAEPGSVSLMLGALGLLGIVVRRKNRLRSP